MDVFISLMHDFDDIPKRTPIISHNMIKMGGGISKGLNSVSTQNQRCHQLLLFTRDSTFFVWYMNMYMTLDVSKI